MRTSACRYSAASFLLASSSIGANGNRQSAIHSVCHCSCRKFWNDLLSSSTVVTTKIDRSYSKHTQVLYRYRVKGLRRRNSCCYRYFRMVGKETRNDTKNIIWFVQISTKSHRQSGKFLKFQPNSPESNCKPLDFRTDKTGIKPKRAETRTYTYWYVPATFLSWKILRLCEFFFMKLERNSKFYSVYVFM